MAVPNPEKELARLESTLKGDKARVIVLQGAARWFRDRALDRIRAAAGEQAELSELDGAESGGGASEAGRFLLDLRTSSLFGSNKILLLRNSEGWLRQHGGPLSETIGRIAKGNLLVLTLAKLDGRSSLAKKIKKIGAVFEFRQLYDKAFGSDRPDASSELVRWLVQRARTHGVQLRPEAGLFMTEVVGDDPGQLDGELVRIRPLLAGKQVTPEALRGVLTVSFGSTQFELVDALLNGDALLALRSMRAMFREGLRDKTGKPIETTSVFPIVSSWLLQSVSKLLEARAEVESGVPRGAVVAQYGGFFKDRFARQLDKHSVSSLVAILGSLHRAERRLRTTGELPEILLERLIAEAMLPIRGSLLGKDGAAW